MSIEGKKIKLHVGKMKEAIDALSIEGDATKDKLVQCFRLLLISEIAQRGVIVPLDATEEQILPSIINVAGKSLIDEKNLKSPLIAGAAAVSAMISEKCASIAFQMSGSVPITILKEDQCTGAFQRCMDVKDIRFLVLLDIATKLNLVKEGMNISHAKVTSLLLHRIAFGNYLRACAFSNPDQPPVFKRALESCLQGQALLAHLQQQDVDQDNMVDDDFSNYYTRDAITPLQNLVRIALSKNNEKRANELYLRLVQSYSGNREGDGSAQVLSVEGSKCWNEINHSYIVSYDGDPIRSVVGDSFQSMIQYAIKAKELIDKVHDIYFDRESDLKLIILHKLLTLQVMALHEELLVGIISNQRYVASVNRSGLSLGTATTATFETQARKDFIAGRLSSSDIDGALYYDSSSFDAASMDLCKCFLSVGENGISDLPCKLVDAVCVVIERQLERRILVAQTIALDKVVDDDDKKDDVFHHWNNVFSLIEPLLDSITGKDEESVGKAIRQMSPSRQSLMVAASEGLCVYNWMTYFEGRVESSHIEAAAHVVSNVFMLMKEAQIKDKEEKNKCEVGTGKVVIINNNDCFSESYLRMEILYHGSKYQRHLLSIGYGYDTSSQDIRTVEALLEETIAMSKLITESKVAKEFINKVGLPYMQFLAAWSGLFESPWSHCNLSQARSIIAYVRSSVRDLTSSWGRKIHKIEDTLLDMGEADSECGVLPGGGLSVALRLYEVSLKKVKSIPGCTICVILKAHCESFQLRMQSSQVSEVYDATNLLKDYEERMKLNIAQLRNISFHTTMDRVYCWTDEPLKSSISYHISFQRHLFADILIKATKIKEAQYILEEAVEAAPMNYDAAFSYGAFLLQIASYGHQCSDPDLMKQAQVQLLKSAKLDVLKADPFALLGIWFETQQDLKRSAGCYSKALLIDPSHPVAGRGILRVKKSTDLTSVLSRAIDNGIYQSGWAWKASGDHSAFVVGDHERAIRCYQQALRSHDIWNPKQFGLNLFFSFPGESVLSYYEYSNTWSSLGASYRHLGKYSAALRAFQAAHEKLSSDSSNFCSWAQVEMELGLLDEASEKFQKVLDSGQKDSQIDAGYGLSSCMLASARKAQEEGKFGTALSNLKRGIATLNILIDSHHGRSFHCIWKMLGDLYSSGFDIPISAFANSNSDGYREKLDFMRQGEAAYSHIVTDISKLSSAHFHSDAICAVLSTALNDLGINCLLRARFCAESRYEGNGVETSTRWADDAKDKAIQELFDSAISYFVDALTYNTLSSCSWVGIGYAVIAQHPVFAQHAFCRALQVDKNNVDAWANLCLLYLHYDDINASKECVDSLTQVSDSSVIWLARGYHIEEDLKLEPAKGMRVLSKACDAYKASLQTSRQQGAVLGLSLMARKLAKMTIKAYDLDSDFDLFLRESFANLEIYLSLNGSHDFAAMALCGITSLEEAINLNLQGYLSLELAHIFIQKGTTLLQHTRDIVTSFLQYNCARNEDTWNEMYANNEMGRNVCYSASVQDVTKELTNYSDAAQRFSDKKCNLHTGIYIEEKTSINVARQKLLGDPSDSLLWLQLSKALLQWLISSSTMESYEATLAAVKRAKETMILDVSNSLGFDTVQGLNQTSMSSPLSTHLSEVFALSYSIRDICSETKNSTCYDLQKSVILDPENYIARSMIP